MGLLSSILGSGHKNGIIDKAIEHLGKEGSIMGTAFREISYRDVINYIKSNDCKILNVTKKPRGDWIEFLAKVGGVEYTVWLDKTFEGDGSVLTAQRSV